VKDGTDASKWRSLLIDILFVQEYFDE
jgi:hypothetical protein